MIYKVFDIWVSGIQSSNTNTTTRLNYILPVSTDSLRYILKLDCCSLNLKLSVLLALMFSYIPILELNTKDVAEVPQPTPIIIYPHILILQLLSFYERLNSILWGQG